MRGSKLIFVPGGPAGTGAKGTAVVVCSEGRFFLGEEQHGDVVCVSRS